MNKQGIVVRWDTARGFGFIRSPATDADVFFHVRDFRGASAPTEGLEVTYEEIHVGGKGPRAMAVQPRHAGGRPAPSRASPPAPAQRQDRPPNPAARPMSQRSPTPVRDAPAAPVLLLMLAWAALAGWGVWAGRLPGLVLVAVPILNLLTFYVYWQDKHAAQKGHWRTRESTLHGLALAGGWPGAWAAHQVLRHKSRKTEFRAMYWVTVALNCAALGAWLFWLPLR
jgi:uncharacterized membrane protein YsdA (DUF1294 family)/cold shock CspA family protein